MTKRKLKQSLKQLKRLKWINKTIKKFQMKKLPLLFHLIWKRIIYRTNYLKILVMLTRQKIHKCFQEKSHQRRMKWKNSPLKLKKKDWKSSTTFASFKWLWLWKRRRKRINCGWIVRETIGSWDEELGSHNRNRKWRWTTKLSFAIEDRGSHKDWRIITLRRNCKRSYVRAKRGNNRD